MCRPSWFPKALVAAVILAASLLNVDQVAAQAVEPDIPTTTNRLTLQVLATEKASLPAATRALAMVHLAMYDTLAAVDGAYPALQIETTAAGAALDAALATAGHRVLADMFPKQKSLIDASLTTLLNEQNDSSAKRRGVELGENVARGILAWRTRDGIEKHSPYYPSRKAGRWAPTLPGYGGPDAPYWAAVRPFAIREVSSFRPSEPPKLASKEYAEAVSQVQHLGVRDSRDRTAEQSATARFWDAGPMAPVAYWNRIAAGVADARRLTTAERTRLFALLNTTLADTAIVTWDAKYQHDAWRPVTAIHQAGADDNPETSEEYAWQPLLVTPATPGYPSEHSTISSAAATVLAYFFETNDIGFDVVVDEASARSQPDADDDKSSAQPPSAEQARVAPRVPSPRSRSYTSFSAAAEEAGQSRVWGGVQFAFDHAAGIAVGRDVAEQIIDKRFPRPKPRDRVDLAADDAGWRAARPAANVAAKPLSARNNIASRENGRLQSVMKSSTKAPSGSAPPIIAPAPTILSGACEVARPISPTDSYVPPAFAGPTTIQTPATTVYYLDAAPPLSSPVITSPPIGSATPGSPSPIYSSPAYVGPTDYLSPPLAW